MTKLKFVVIALAVAIAFAPVTADAQRRGFGSGFGGSGSAGVNYLGGCVISIMIAAVDKGKKYKKELTTDEAATCGLLYWIKEATKK